MTSLMSLNRTGNSIISPNFKARIPAYSSALPLKPISSSPPNPSLKPLCTYTLPNHQPTNKRQVFRSQTNSTHPLKQHNGREGTSKSRSGWLTSAGSFPDFQCRVDLGRGTVRDGCWLVMTSGRNRLGVASGGTSRAGGAAVLQLLRGED